MTVLNFECYSVEKTDEGEDAKKPVMSVAERIFRMETQNGREKCAGDARWVRRRYSAS